MKNQIFVSLIAGLMLSACAQNGRPRTNQNEPAPLMMKEYREMTLYYPYHELNSAVFCEYEVYTATDMWGDWADYFRTLQSLPIRDSLLMDRIVTLYDGLGFYGKIRPFRVSPEIALIYKNGNVCDTIGIGWAANSAIDSSRRGILYPSPELFDIVTNYIAEHDEKWKSIQKLYHSHPTAPYELLQKETGSFADSTRTFCIDNPALIRIIDGQNIIEVSETTVKSRIRQLIELDGCLFSEDQRFSLHKTSQLIYQTIDSSDTLYLGGGRFFIHGTPIQSNFERIHSSQRGDLYPNPELTFLIEKIIDSARVRPN